MRWFWRDTESLKHLELTHVARKEKNVRMRSYGDVLSVHDETVNRSSKSVLLLSVLLFDNISFFWKKYLETIFFNADATLAASMSKIKEHTPLINCDVRRSSTSLIPNIARVRQLEWGHTSVLKFAFRHWKPQESGNLSKCYSDWFLGNSTMQFCG